MAKVRDRNGFPKALIEIAKASVRKAKVGMVHSPALAAIAHIHEFGADVQVGKGLAGALRGLAREHGAPTEGLPKEGDRMKIPERSFLRSAADASMAEVDAVTEAQVRALVLGDTGHFEAVKAVGEVVQRAAIDRVARAEGLAPNDPFTVAVKGHDRPLIGKTGVFESSMGIQVKVVQK